VNSQSGIISEIKLKHAKEMEEFAAKLKSAKT